MEEKEPKELLLVAKLKNNRIIKMREKLGLTSARALADASGVSYHAVVKYESLKLSPVRDKDLEWKDSAVQLSTFLGVDCEWLWPSITVSVQRNKVELELNAAQARAMLEPAGRGDPEKLLTVKRDYEEVQREIANLTPIERDILSRRFGDDGETLEEIGASYGLSGERTRQLGEQALSKIRGRMMDKHPDEEIWERGVPWMDRLQ